jgi:hypothetical protein
VNNRQKLKLIFAGVAIGLAQCATISDANNNGSDLGDGRKTANRVVTIDRTGVARMPLYTTASDIPGRHSWQSAGDYCANLHAFGHQDWRVPSKTELNVLFKNRVAIGEFDVSGRFPMSWYWSSLENPVAGKVAWAQRFSDGFQSWAGNGAEWSLRCVRG